MSAGEHQRYRFGPLERRGLIGSLRPAQVVLIAASLTAGVILMRTLSSGIGVVSALALASAHGRVLLLADQRPLGRGVASDRRPATRSRGRSARHIRRSPAPLAGTRLAADGRPEPVAALPEVGRDLELLAAPFHGETVGVIKDRRAHSYTAVLAVQCDVVRPARPRRTGGAGRPAGARVLAGLAREGSPVSRIQWIERTVPADGDEIGRYLGEAWDRDAVAARLARHAVLPRADDRAPRP